MVLREGTMHVLLLRRCIMDCLFFFSWRRLVFYVDTFRMEQEKTFRRALLSLSRATMEELELASLILVRA